MNYLRIIATLSIAFFLSLEKEVRLPAKRANTRKTPTIQNPSCAIDHQRILDELPHATFEIDADGQLLYISKAWADFTGYSLAETIGKSLYEFMVETEHYHVKRLYEPGSLDDGPSRFYAYFSTKTGLPRYLLVVVHGHYDADANFSGAVGTLVLASEDELPTLSSLHHEVVLSVISYAAEEFLKADDWDETLQHVLQRLGSATKASRIRIMQRQLTSKDGIRVRDVAAWQKNSQEWTPVNHQFSLSEQSNFILRRLEMGYSVELQRSQASEMIQKKLDKWAAASLLILPIPTSKGIWGYFSLTDSQVERHWSSVEKETLYVVANLLGAAIERRQSDQAQERYAQQLQEHNRDMDTFLKIVTHDLKDPLNVIIQTAEMTRLRFGDGMSDDVRTRLERIEARSKYMDTMIHQLLEVAQLFGRGQRETEPVAVGRLVEQVLDQFHEAIVENAIEVEMVEPLPIAMGYSVWVHEIFSNLVSNAIKYRGADKPNPQILIRGEVQKDGMVRYEVIDNGIGLASEMHEQVFKLFRRGKHRDVTGYGLGLALVRRMVTAMQGNFGVESVLGMGSTFWFTLPAYTGKMET